MNDQTTVAVFDFDKTIVSKDTGFEFIRHFTYRHPLRAIAAVPIWPLAILLMLVPPIRHWGISLCTWLSTFPCREDEFDAMRDEFLAAFFGVRGARAYTQALDKLREHLAARHRVLVVTGSPTSLVRAVLTHLRFDVDAIEIVGSSDALLFGGIVCPQHCIGENKVRMARAAGHDPETWTYGYSDSRLDIPLLRHCRRRTLVNPRGGTVERWRQAFGDSFEIVDWR